MTASRSPDPRADRPQPPGGTPDAPAWRGCAPTAEATRSIGRALAAAVGPGDVLVLAGSLGAGKTTLVQGLAAGLGVVEPVTSPTFVLVRQLRGGRLPLVHVDAYRLGSGLELDDLDLDTDLSSAVVAVEWGEGLAERLAESRLDVTLTRRDDDARVIEVRAVGPRWRDAPATVTPSGAPDGRVTVTGLRSLLDAAAAEAG